MTLLAGTLAALIGLSLGMLGGGGSILTVPVLVYVLGYAPKDAIAVSLAVVGATSLAGALLYWREGLVNLRLAAAFGVVAMAGTALGARAAQALSGTTQLLLFAGVMLVAAVFMLGRAVPSGATGEAATPRTARHVAATAIQGLAVGVLTGLVGVGGGFLIVPALVLLAGVPMREAVGTSLAVIAMNSAVGLRGYLGQAHVGWAFTTLFAGAMVPGMLSGTYLARLVPQSVLRRTFAFLLLALGGWMLYANRAAVLTW
jgi:uncharacterized membrane protein YfcA